VAGGHHRIGRLLSAVVIAAAEPSDRTFAILAGPVQTLMSITVPFLGILLVSDRVRQLGGRRSFLGPSG